MCACKVARICASARDGGIVCVRVFHNALTSLTPAVVLPPQVSDPKSREQFQEALSDYDA